MYELQIEYQDGFFKSEIGELSNILFALAIYVQSRDFFRARIWKDGNLIAEFENSY